MKTLEMMIQTLCQAGRCPEETIRSSVKETGKPAVGCFPLFVPEELVYAAGNYTTKFIFLNSKKHFVIFLYYFVCFFYKYPFSTNYNRLAYIFFNYNCSNTFIFYIIWQ